VEQPASLIGALNYRTTSRPTSDKASKRSLSRAEPKVRIQFPPAVSPANFDIARAGDETGKHVWAERYDRDLADIFALEDEITEAVTIAVAPAIAEVEQQRAMLRPPDNLDTWAAYQRGLWHFCKMSAADNALAQKFFQQAIDCGPTFSGGYKGVAMALLQGTTAFQTRRPPEVQSLSEELARRAVALDGADAEARSCLGWALWRRGDYDGALAEAERALAMAPNLAFAHGVRGSVLMCSGRPKDGLASLERSTRLDPRGPNSAVRLAPGGTVLLLLARI